MFKRKYKLVEISDGTFAIRSHWFFGWKFISRAGGLCVRLNTDDFKDYCTFLEYERAKKMCDELNNPPAKLSYKLTTATKEKDFL